MDSIEPLEALRFRWRGDTTELAIVGLLGETYSELGRWRDALATMRIAADRFPHNPAARHLRADSFCWKIGSGGDAGMCRRRAWRAIMSDLAAWLEAQGFGQYVELFAGHAIDREALVDELR